MRLAQEGVVQSYARNNHLEFSIPYELYGQSHGYEPDFLVRLSNGVTVVLEIKGQAHDETAAKHQAARRWVAAVNHWAGLGRWEFLVCYEPQRLAQAVPAL